MPYRLSALAEQDLDEIWSYVAEDANAATADRLIDAISIDSSCSSNNLAWVAIGPSSAKAFGRSPLRATSSTIGTAKTS
jgi:hypothetical protein